MARRHAKTHCRQEEQVKFEDSAFSEIWIRVDCLQTLDWGKEGRVVWIIMWIKLPATGGGGGGGGGRLRSWFRSPSVLYYYL